MGNVAVDILLGLGVACELVCCLGVFALGNVFDRLHYAAAGTTLGPLLVLAAVLSREHLSAAGLEAIAAVGFLALLNPVLTIATARAARRVDYGDVRSLPEEHSPEGMRP